MTRDIRIINAVAGQQMEYDEMYTRMGKIMYRDIGITSKMSLFDSGKALIVGSGLRVEPSSGMTVNVPAGIAYQRISSQDIIPVYQPVDQTVTLDAASGSARVDIIEAQIKAVTDKDDMSYIVIQTGPLTERQWQPIKRDIKYYLNVRKQFDTTTTTAATPAIFQSPQVVTTLDLRFKYLISLTIGEDGSYIDIDCRGVAPAATTRQEIIDHINAAVGFTMASTWDTNKIQLTGQGSGETSFFMLKPPVSDPGVDATNLIFGLAETAYYKYIYTGENAWFKICELDIGTTTTEITATEIRNIDEKSTWASEAGDILLADQIFETIQKEENGDLFIKNTDNTKDVTVKTNDTERWRITADGKLSTNQATSTVTTGGLDLKTPSDTGIGLNINNSTTEVFKVYNNGKIITNGATPTVTAGGIDFKTPSSSGTAINVNNGTDDVFTVDNDGDLHVHNKIITNQATSTVTAGGIDLKTPSSSGTAINVNNGTDDIFTVNNNGDFNVYTIKNNGKIETNYKTNNVALGDAVTGEDMSTGSSNLLLGQGSGLNITSGSNSIIIGTNNAGSNVSTKSNAIVIGNLPGSNTAAGSPCYIANIYSQSYGASPRTVQIGSEGKIGAISSSLRYKDNVTETKIDISKIYDIKPYKFVYKNDDYKREEIGYIAEYFDEFLPEFVTKGRKEDLLGENGEKYDGEDKDDIIVDSVNYIMLCVPIIECLKEHKKMIDKLKKEINTLKSNQA